MLEKDISKARGIFCRKIGETTKGGSLSSFGHDNWYHQTCRIADFQVGRARPGLNAMASQSTTLRHSNS